MAAPCALFASSSNDFAPEEFIKLILTEGNLPPGQHVTESIKAYDWHIDTKYYTADVKLCTSAKRTIGDTEFADSVQAFIVYFDPKQESTFELTKAWLPYLEQIDPEILILVCDNCSDGDAVSRLKAQQWCIDNGFELVELNPLPDTDPEDLEDDFVETTSIKRVIQALHAHTWPNLDMKQNPVIGSSYYQQLLKEESELKANEVKTKNCSQNSQSPDSVPVDGGDLAHSGGAEHAGKVDETKGVKKPSGNEVIDSLLPDDEMALLAALGNEDPGEESFEEMFHKLKVMKDKAETMPPDQRKMYAEKIAVSFWKAIGGDEGEIEGLDDSDHDPS